MKVLMISTDRKIFEKGSDVRSRVIEYGNLFEELHIVVFRRRIKNQESRIKNTKKIANNIFAYPTNSISRLLYVLDAVKLGKRIIQNSKFDIKNSVITCQDPFETGLAGWLIARKFKVKLQLQIHTDFLNPHFVKHLVFDKNRLRVKIAEFLLPKADCIRVVSKRIADSLAKSNIKVQQSRIKILPIFVDVEKIRKAPVKIDMHKKYPQFDFIILTASRLEKEKNIPLAISAMKDVIKKYSRTGLIIVGDGSEGETLKLQIANCKLQNNIILENWQDKETIYSYCKTADLFLVTSDYEGYGLTTIEALASGLPVLSTDVGAAREAGAEITSRDSIAESIVKYMSFERVREKGILKYLPYKNKREYLDKFKDSIEKCGQYN